MNKVLVLLFTVAFAAGCQPATEAERITKHLNWIHDHAEVVVIDGCQYIFMETGVNDNYSMAITHKGNCTNSIHQINH